MRTPRHLPRNTAARDLRERLKNQREFDKKFDSHWWMIKESQRFNSDIEA